MTMTLNKGFWMPLSVSTLPIPITNLIAWYDATDISTITKGYVTKAQTATGTILATSFTTSGDISADLFPNMLVRLNGTDIYTIASVSGTTVNVTSALTANYVASAFAVEGISQWNDKSGNGNNATQGTAANQPGYIPNAVTTNAAISFFGGQFMSLPNGVYDNIGSNACTMFASSLSNQQDYIGYILGFRDGSNNSKPYLRYDNSSTGGISFNNSGGGGAIILATNTNWAVSRGRRNGTTQALAINNSAETTNTNATDSTSANGQMGASNNAANSPLDARVMDIIIYNASLSSPNIATVEQYMAAKCGVTLS